MEQRLQFVEERGRGLYTMTELCERFGIRRKTGYKWVDRFKEEGKRGLVDRSRAPRRCRHRMSPEVEELLVVTKKAHPTWGAGKLLDYLRPRHVGLKWPAKSTAGDLLKRLGLTKKKRRRQKPVHPGVVAPVTKEPNDIWTVDFKGQFRTGDGVYCYPLTVLDLHSRCLLACHGLPSTKGEGVRPVFERLFKKYGLPKAIRSDNGVPFATTAVHGLSVLNVWWMRLGIVHQRIAPGCPQQNGAHERMHKTMKAEACRPARSNMKCQQKAFDAFREEYNNERPHESLDGETPGSRYVESRHRYNGDLPLLKYPSHYLVKRVTEGGTVRLKQGKLLYLSTALVGSHVGFEEIEDGTWSVYFGVVLLGRVDETEATLRF